MGCGMIPNSNYELTDKFKNMTILLSGAPGTGKSAVQRLAPGYFRDRFGEAASIGTDEIYTIVDPDWSQTNEHWKEIARDNCILLVRNLFLHGIRVVLIGGNDLYTQLVVNQFLAALLPTSAVFHFTLDAQLEVVVQRVGQRGDLPSHPAEWLAGWLDHIRTHYAAWTQVIDTSYLTPEETLEIIHRKVLQRDGELIDLIA